jgi:hypothetical protein
MKIKMKRIRKCTRILFFVFLLFVSSAAQERRLLPVDVAGKDASFRQFRDKLISAARRRDHKFVLSVVDRNIRNGFGGADGIENFKKQWKPASAKSHLWDELLFVLTHGGAFERASGGKTFWAPYVYSNFPDKLDAFEYSAVTEKSVKLLSAPRASSRIVADLSYTVVKVDYQNSVKDKSNAENYAWLKVETLGGKSGYLPGRFVRSPIGYRAAFEKNRGGLWKMVAFLAGD